MKNLRQRMLEDRRIINFSATTKKRYLDMNQEFVNFFNKSHKLLESEDICVFYIVREKKFSSSSIKLTVSSLKFLYKVALGCKWEIEKIYFARRKRKLPFIIIPYEMVHFLKAVENKKIQDDFNDNICSLASIARSNSA